MEIDEFGKSVEALIPRLRRYARSLTRDPHRADDLVQDCLCRAIRKRDLFQPDTDLRAWLFTILHNTHVNTVRASVREGIQIDVDDVSESLGQPETQSGPVLLRQLGKAMAELSVEQQQVLLLIGLEGMSYEEVAAILAVPVGTVRSRLSRARADLRIRLEREPSRAA